MLKNRHQLPITLKTAIVKNFSHTLIHRRKDSMQNAMILRRLGRVPTACNLILVFIARRTPLTYSAQIY